MQAFEGFLQKIEDPAHRSRVTEVLGWVHKTFPQLELAVKWNQPMFIDHGTFIIAFSVAKQHLAVAPEYAALEKFEADIKQAGYSSTAMLMRIRWDQQVDYALLGLMIDINIMDKKDHAAFWRVAPGGKQK